MINETIIENLPYWKTSKSSPDTWFERTVKLILDFGGELINQAQGVDHLTGDAAFLITFKLQGDIFKIVFPVLAPKKPTDKRAAKVQAATILYHDVKSRLISAEILGARNVFFGNLLLEGGLTLSEIENPKLSIEKILQIAEGSQDSNLDIVDANYRTINNEN